MLTTDPAGVPCTSCSRPAATWCRTASGTYATPHQPRLQLAAVTVLAPSPLVHPSPRRWTLAAA